MEHASEVFSKDRPPEQGPVVKDLHAKIGQLSMENDFYQTRSVASAMRAQRND